MVTWFHSSLCNSVLPQVAQPQDGCHGPEIELFMRLPFIFYDCSNVNYSPKAHITVINRIRQYIFKFFQGQFFSRLTQKEKVVIKKP